MRFHAGRQGPGWVLKKSKKEGLEPGLQARFRHLFPKIQIYGVGEPAQKNTSELFAPAVSSLGTWM